MHTSGKPVALIQSAWGGTRVEAWMPAEAIAAAAPSAGAHPPSKEKQNNVSVLYNAMVKPWDKYAVRAALWYQGEANADQKIPGNDQTEYYAAMYQAMIASWRELKGMGDFAFMTVQLPPSLPSTADPTKELGTGRMQIRLAEAEASPHSGGLTDISGPPITCPHAAALYVINADVSDFCCLAHHAIFNIIGTADLQQLRGPNVAH